MGIKEQDQERKKEGKTAMGKMCDNLRCLITSPDETTSLNGENGWFSEFLKFMKKEGIIIEHNQEETLDGITVIPAWKRI